MKGILIISTVSGFLDKFEQEDIKILQSMGYRIYFASNMKEQHYIYDEEQLKKEGVHAFHIDIARSPYLLRPNLRAARQLIKIIKENNIAAVHCHEPVGGVLGRVMGMYFQNRGLQVVYTAHGFHFYKGAPLINRTLYYAAERVMAHHTDILITINREDYKNACRFRLRDKGRVYQIPGVGLDLDKFSPMDEKERKMHREALGLTEEDFFIVSVGELNENKNHIVLLEALSAIKAKGGASSIKYGICGDGFFHDQIRAWIRELDIEENVLLFGYCQNVQDILGCADISAFPSIREGLGMAGLEALSMGIPLLASDNRGTREYMKDKENGIVCSACDKESWIRAINYMRSLSESDYNSMREKCRESVTRFRKENVIRKMQKIYGELDRRVMHIEAKRQ